MKGRQAGEGVRGRDEEGDEGCGAETGKRRVGGTMGAGREGKGEDAGKCKCTGRSCLRHLVLS